MNLQKHNKIDIADGVVTISQALDKLGEQAPSRETFQKAIERKLLPTVKNDGQRGHCFLWADVERLIGEGKLQKRAPKAARDCSTAAAKQEAQDAEPQEQSQLEITAGEDGAATAAIDFNIIAPSEVVPEKEASVSDLNNLLAELPGLKQDDLISRLKSYVGLAEAAAAEARDIGSRALAYAWGCGLLLRKLKSSMRHGEWTPWVEENLAPHGISERSCQRYMKLVKQYQDFNQLAATNVTLKEAYQTFHPQAKEPAEDDKTAKVTPSAEQALLSHATEFQKRLRLFNASEVKMSAEGKAQLDLTMDAINSFHKQCQNKFLTNTQNAAA